MRVRHEDVVEAGLIKEKIITQTKEDLEAIKKQEYDQELLLLDLAYNKGWDCPRASILVMNRYL